jgi:hypothetical protein
MLVKPVPSLIVPCPYGSAQMVQIPLLPQSVVPLVPNSGVSAPTFDKHIQLQKLRNSYIQKMPADKLLMLATNNL